MHLVVERWNSHFAGWHGDSTVAAHVYLHRTVDASGCGGQSTLVHHIFSTALSFTTL
jgi:cysteinyl-tRNA synthetase